MQQKAVTQFGETKKKQKKNNEQIRFNNFSLLMFGMLISSQLNDMKREKKYIKIYHLAMCMAISFHWRRKKKLWYLMLPTEFEPISNIQKMFFFLSLSCLASSVHTNAPNKRAFRLWFTQPWMNITLNKIENCSIHLQINLRCTCTYTCTQMQFASIGIFIKFEKKVWIDRLVFLCKCLVIEILKIRAFKLGQCYFSCFCFWSDDNAEKSKFALFIFYYFASSKISLLFFFVIFQFLISPKLLQSIFGFGSNNKLFWGQKYVLG